MIRASYRCSGNLLCLLSLVRPSSPQKVEYVQIFGGIVHIFQPGTKSGFGKCSLAGPRSLRQPSPRDALTILRERDMIQLPQILPNPGVRQLL